MVAISKSAAPKGGGGMALLGTPSCASTVAQNAPFACQLTTALSGTVTWSLTGSIPDGMVIQPKSGWIHWTPTTGQKLSGGASYTINAVASNGGSTDPQNFPLTVTNGTSNPAGIYVSVNGNDSNNGSASNPLRTLDKASKKVAAGDTIYIRGGEYFNAEYGTSWSSRTDNALVKFTTTGTSGNPITVRNFGNEYAKLTSDVHGINLGLGANYYTFQGLDIQGPNEASLDEATTLANWWEETGNRISGRGITSRGDHVTVTDCVIHDFPAGGIVSNDAEYFTVENNIVYNNAWWSTGGTHGITISSMPSTSYSTTNTIKVSGNLTYGNQSLMISHVFGKGFVTLGVDEGSAIHIQNAANAFKKGVLIDKNLMVFNGKGGINFNNVANPALGGSWSPVTVTNNSSYYNARVVTEAADLIFNATATTNTSNNLFHPRSAAATLRDTTSPLNTFSTNSNYTLTGITGDTSLPSGFTTASAVFNGPTTFDFAPASGISSSFGVPSSNRSWMFAKLSEWGLTITEPTQTVNLSTIKQYLFDNWPASMATVPLNAGGTGNLRLDDPVTGYSYYYGQRCHYPNNPAGQPTCP